MTNLSWTWLGAEHCFSPGKGRRTGASKRPFERWCGSHLRSSIFVLSCRMSSGVLGKVVWVARGCRGSHVADRILRSPGCPCMTRAQVGLNVNPLSSARTLFFSLRVFFFHFSYLVLKWFALPHTIYLSHVFYSKGGLKEKKKKTKKRLLVHYKPIAYLLLKNIKNGKDYIREKSAFWKTFVAPGVPFLPATLPLCQSQHLSFPIICYFQLERKRQVLGCVTGRRGGRDPREPTQIRARHFGSTIVFAIVFTNEKNTHKNPIHLLYWLWKES